MCTYPTRPMGPEHGQTERNRQQQPGRQHRMRASACASPGKAEGGTGRPPPIKKTTTEGGGGGARKQPTATKPPANTTRGGQTPPPEGTEDRTPKEAQGDQPAKTGNTKPGTAADREKGHRNKQTHATKRKKRASSPARKKRDVETGTTRPGTGTSSHQHHKKRKRKENTPTTQPRRAGHSRDPGPARTPTPHA